MWLALPYWQHSSIKQQSKVDMSLKCDLQYDLEIECVIANLKPKQEELRVKLVLSQTCQLQGFNYIFKLKAKAYCWSLTGDTVPDKRP